MGEQCSNIAEARANIYTCVHTYIYESHHMHVQQGINYNITFLVTLYQLDISFHISRVTYYKISRSILPAGNKGDKIPAGN